MHTVLLNLKFLRASAHPDFHRFFLFFLYHCGLDSQLCTVCSQLLARMGRCSNNSEFHHGLELADLLIMRDQVLLYGHHFIVPRQLLHRAVVVMDRRLYGRELQIDVAQVNGSTFIRLVGEELDRQFTVLKRCNGVDRRVEGG